MSAPDMGAGLDALARSDYDLPAEPGDPDLIARLDAACEAADGERLERAMTQAEQDYAAWRESVFGPADDEGDDQ